jgi:hypothetical protein
MRLNVLVLIANAMVYFVNYLDLYMLLLIARLLLGRHYAERPSVGFAAIKAITDPLPETICRSLQALRRKPVSMLMPWCLVLIAGLVLRYVLVEFVRVAL